MPAYHPKFQTADWYLPWSYRIETLDGIYVRVFNGAGQLAATTHAFPLLEDAEAWAESHARSRAEGMNAVINE